MIIHTTRDAWWLPQPNTIEVVSSDIMAPAHLTRTSFMIPLTRKGTVIMANNRRRGLEFPGGHVDPGETLTFAAVRETTEETGYRVSHIKAIGYQMMISKGEMPPGYKYPFPLSFQQFFVGEVMGYEPYLANDECLDPVELSVFEALRTLSSSRAALLMLAVRKF
jgi:8-oxo-dGTP pyrophosphatase MutT (NUDIX family)